mgnify:CR=1 FL=1
MFSSPEDLLFRTPDFYASASRRLNDELHGVLRYADEHFGGPNPYIEAIEKNIQFARELASKGEVRLRRQPPS